MAYKWNSPHDWLLEKAETFSEPATLYKLIESLVWRLDSDSIQDLFQEEMDQDGYFNEVKEES